MSTPVTYLGVTYNIPSFGDGGYAQGAGNLSLYLIALSNGSLTTSGGIFTLTGDANFGSSFGLIAPYYKSSSANIASAGVLRLANVNTIAWRNFANSGNDVLAVNNSDQLTFNGVPVAGSGAGVLSITGTADEIIASSATGAVTLSTPQPIGTTSSVTFGQIIDAGLTASRAVATDGSSQLVSSATTATELGFVNGVTSAIQTQLNGKQATGNYITALTGDVTASGPGSAATTLATVNANVGSFTAANITVNAKGLITAASNGIAAFVAPTVQTFTTGSGTYTRPTSPTPLYLRVRMIGGGGGGSGSGVTGGGSVGSGGGGGSTTFGSSFLTANPGGGGVWGFPSGTGGGGGTAIIGAGATGLAITGTAGGGNSVNNANGDLAGGIGAGSFFAGPACYGSNNQNGGDSPVNTGAGGQGGGTQSVNTSATGAGGGSGGYIDAIIPTPSSSYSYSIGSGGSRGTAGSSGFMGGAGGTGFIIVEEFYQ